MAKLARDHQIIKVAHVDPARLTKPTEEVHPELLLRATDPDFVQQLSIAMLANPAAQVPPWFVVVFLPKGKHKRF